MIERYWKPFVVLFLSAFLFLSLTSMSQKSPIVDEPVHLAAGYSYLVTRDFRLNPEHPPLIKMIAAAPLLLLGLDFRTDELTSWDGVIGFPTRFVFRNSLPADVIVFWGRLPIVLISAALGWFTFWWARQLAGILAGMLALALYVLDPNIMAHSQLVTTDVGLAALFALAVYVLVRYLGRPTRLNLWLVGGAFALALLAKFSAVFIIPTYALITLVHLARRGWSALWSSWWRLSAVMVAATIVLTFVAYGFEMRTIGRAPASAVAFLERHTSPSSAVRGVILAVGSNIPVPAPSFWKGMLESAGRQERASYLRGQSYAGSRPDYFPVAFAVKTPVGTLALLFIASLVLAYRVFFAPERVPVSLDEWAVLLSAAVFFGLTILNGHNIGVRYLLPILPLIFIFIASQLNWLYERRGRWKLIVPSAVVALVTFVLVSSLRTYPHYLAYFNEFVGGPRNGWRYLVDSNLDWGQDLPGLKTYLKLHNIDDVYLNYFGPTRCGPRVCSEVLDYYGIRWKPVPSTEEVARTGAPRGVVAVSISWLTLYDPKGDSWLWAYRPTATIGHSIWVFDLRDHRPERVRS